MPCARQHRPNPRCAENENIRRHQRRRNPTFAAEQAPDCSTVHARADGYACATELATGRTTAGTR
jgi:hypothetical protein